MLSRRTPCNRLKRCGKRHLRRCCVLVGVYATLRFSTRTNFSALTLFSRSNWRCNLERKKKISHRRTWITLTTWPLLLKGLSMNSCGFSSNPAQPDTEWSNPTADIVCIFFSMCVFVFLHYTIYCLPCFFLCVRGDVIALKTRNLIVEHNTFDICLNWMSNEFNIEA